MENTFRKDVMDDIQWEKDNINKQIELLEPMKKALHRSAGMKMLSTTGYVFMEFVLWILALGFIVYAVFLYNMSPFYEMSNTLYTAVQNGSLKDHEMTAALWTIRIMVILFAVLMIVIARQFGKLRKKANITSVAGKTIADMYKKLEERMHTLLAFEEKYNYLLDKDIKIELNQFTNPLEDENFVERLLPPKGDRLLDE